jgi:hypothetical protein
LARRSNSLPLVGLDGDPPLLSVVVVIVGDTIDSRCDAKLLSATLEALASQSNPPMLEIIVPYHGGISGIDELKALYPNVTFLFVEELAFLKANSREHHDELRSCGVRESRGTIVAFLEDHVCPRPDWASRVLNAHLKENVIVGGAIENGIDTPLNWANYFCDLGKYQNPVPSGPSPCASLVNASYKRVVLDSIESVWRDRFNETVVNHELLSRGETITLERDIIVTQKRQQLKWKPNAAEFYIWGRSYASSRSIPFGKAKRLVYAVFAFLLPLILVTRIGARVARRGKVEKFLKCLPLIVLLTTSWSLGELMGYFGQQHNDLTSNPKSPQRLETETRAISQAD